MSYYNDVKNKLYTAFSKPGSYEIRAIGTCLFQGQLPEKSFFCQ